MSGNSYLYNTFIKGAIAMNHAEGRQKVKVHFVSQVFNGKFISRATGYSAVMRCLGPTQP